MRLPVRLAVCLIIGALAVAGCKRKTAADDAATGAPVAAETPQGQAFLDKNAKAPGVVVLPDGLQYRVERAGPAGGASPQPGDEIKINYEGTLLDGTVFDSSYRRGQPAVMPLDGLVPGWMEALPKMHVGDVWYLYLPSKLGYGARGAGGAIPANAVLVFKVELLGVLPSSPGKTANG